MKSVFADRIGINETSKNDSKKVNGNNFLPSSLSANFPPNHPPIARPRRVVPMMDVQVKTEEPIIGAIILEEMSSITMTEKPAKKELIM